MISKPSNVSVQEHLFGPKLAAQGLDPATLAKGARGLVRNQLKKVAKEGTPTPGESSLFASADQTLRTGHNMEYRLQGLRPEALFRDWLCRAACLSLAPAAPAGMLRRPHPCLRSQAQVHLSSSCCNHSRHSHRHRGWDRGHGG